MRKPDELRFLQDLAFDIERATERNVPYHERINMIAMRHQRFQAAVKTYTEFNKPVRERT